jgi:hypothetical protein
MNKPIKPYAGCPHLQAAKDKKLREALVVELCDRDDIRASGDIANLVMRVIKGMR